MTLKPKRVGHEHIFDCSPVRLCECGVFELGGFYLCPAAVKRLRRMVRDAGSVMVFPSVRGTDIRWLARLLGETK